ncbi:hypothetical protein CK510_14295 [Brunnivagina elsteri CCALA 953]|uniref:Glycosyl transferase n=1 Tax=Brunnivagina elsteri CCALA 953 TaxID=987040 RepID=A0A2A2THW2_9CYAN|nr:hypothetical protein CK510_14295 [Calothrix elsteri CCALA 953]
MEDFGIIIACSDQDYMLAKGCCASIRYFIGDVPICLIVDGDFSTQALEKTYGVKVINKKNVCSDVLRERSFGFGLTKMIAFWESPWKHFLYLDADTIVWFNILKFANFQHYDVIIDKPRYERPDEDICNFFFDIKGIEKYYPDFRWQEHRHHYFCTGAFFGTRDIFKLEEYVEILDLISQCPKLFFPGEQGFLNFMLFRAADRGNIRLGQESIQLLVPDFEQHSLKKRFSFSQSNPIYQNEDVIIHWCGPNKPTSNASNVYSKPMTFYRQKFVSDAFTNTEMQLQLRLSLEDAQLSLSRYKNKFLRKIKLINKKIKF